MTEIAQSGGQVIDTRPEEAFKGKEGGMTPNQNIFIVNNDKTKTLKSVFWSL